MPDHSPFGFHAGFNLWRYVDDRTALDIVLALDVRTYTSNEVFMLLTAYCDLRKFACVKAMYQRYRRIWSEQEFKEKLAIIHSDQERVLRYFTLCEHALGSNSNRSGLP